MNVDVEVMNGTTHRLGVFIWKTVKTEEWVSVRSYNIGFLFLCWVKENWPEAEKLRYFCFPLVES